MNRLQYLEELCLKMIYAKIEEEKSPDCNRTVILAINTAKNAIYREVCAISRKRGLPVCGVIS